jgi:hypothetical protein
MVYGKEYTGNTGYSVWSTGLLGDKAHGAHTSRHGPCLVSVQQRFLLVVGQEDVLGHQDMLGDVDQQLGLLELLDVELLRLALQV